MAQESKSSKTWIRWRPLQNWGTESGTISAITMLCVSIKG